MDKKEQKGSVLTASTYRPSYVFWKRGKSGKRITVCTVVTMERED